LTIFCPKCYHIKVMNNSINKILILLLLLLTTITISHAVATKIHIPNNVSDCNVKYGYTQIKEIGYHNFVCHNPDTDISYYYSKFSTSHGSTGNYTFYLNGNICGTDCDFNGQNCKWGICNISNCDTKNGYTELELEKTNSKNKLWICHKKDTNLSYRPVNTNSATNVFYYDGLKCGIDCDMNGKNCAYDSGGLYPMTGICNSEDCPKGHTIQQGYCKNPDTKELFYKDIDGKFKSDDARSKKVDQEMQNRLRQLYNKKL